MGEVVPLADHRPHLSGTARCVRCGHEWYAVAPIPAPVSLECPECGLSHGYFKWPVDEQEGTEQFICNFCFGSVFNVRKDGVRCASCGFLHELEMVFG